MKKKQLKGRRIAALAADGFEKVELVVPMKAYQLAGAKVDVISLRHGSIRGVNLHEPASRVDVTKTIEEANPNDYDALLVPGGLLNPDLLRQSAKAREFVRAFDAAGKPIASLCHGPWVLASAGLLNGRTLTSWPGVRDDMVNAGATWLDQDVVHDGNLVTSRGPQDMVPFVRASIDLFTETAPIQSRRQYQRQSAPQANEPPQIVLSAMKWLPKPSIRTALGIGAVVAFLLARKGRTSSKPEVRRSPSSGEVWLPERSSSRELTRMSDTPQEVMIHH